jgi:membrane fusion protein (multidrug efflux system)
MIAAEAESGAGSRHGTETTPVRWRKQAPTAPRISRDHAENRAQPGRATARPAGPLRAPARKAERMRRLVQVAVVAVVIAGGVAGWLAFADRGGPARTATAPVAGGANAATAAAQDGRSRGQTGGRPQPVVVAAVRQGLVIDQIESVGTARANEAVTITAKQTGIVSRINFREGQNVAAGAALIELDTGERRADLDNLRAQRDEARKKLVRAQQLRNLTMSEARIDELEAQTRAAEARLRMAEVRLEDQRITAPFNGRLGLRQVSLGALVQPGTVITTLDDISTVKVEFSVPETALSRLRIGLPVKATSPGVENRTFEGEIAIIDTRIDPATRSIRVNARFPNRDESLRPGLFMNVEVVLDRRDNALLIPEEAIVPEGNRHFVFVVDNGRAVRTEVKVGVRQSAQVEIVNGLKPQDSVITRGVQKVRNGQAVVPATNAPSS